MNSRRIISFHNKDMSYDNKVEYILNLRCSCILPFSVIDRNDLKQVIYYTDGFFSINKVCELSALTVLKLLEKITGIIDDLEDYLIFPEEYVLNCNTIYCSASFDRIKLMYIPCKDTENPKDKFIRFAYELKKQCSKTGCVYADLVISFAEEQDTSAGQFKDYIQSLMREVNICEIN